MKSERSNSRTEAKIHNIQKSQLLVHFSTFQVLLKSQKNVIADNGPHVFFFSFFFSIKMMAMIVIIIIVS